MQRVDEQSYFARTSSGRARRRCSWVGTMCEVVTLCSSISRSISSASHLSMSTTLWPRCSELLVQSSTAVWYSGEPVMWTLPSSGCTPKSVRNSE